MLSVIASLVFGILISYTLTSNNIMDSSSYAEHLKNLNFLRSLAGAEREAQITSTAEIHKATIHGLDKIEIPQSLVTDFDRIYAMVAHYLNLKDRGEKVVDWVIDFDSLQEMPPGKEACLGGCPAVLAVLYDPLFNYLFFSPRHMNDYYVTHELLHYFIDEYEEEVIHGLPEVITRQNRTGLPLQNFLKENEEEIAINLAQIIIRKSLAGFVLQESRCVCEPKTVLDIPGYVVCTCVRPPTRMISDKALDCKRCHGTEEIGKFFKK